MNKQEQRIITEAARRAKAERRPLPEVVFDVALYHRFGENEAANLAHKVETSAAATTLGRKGGSVKSPAKSEAAKARNAARKAEGKPEGGRPPKARPEA